MPWGTTQFVGIAVTEQWREMLSDAQRRLFNAACGDLASGLVWYGFRLSKDDWRHLLSGTVLGWRMMPGINMGEGPSLVMLGGSSLDLDKANCTKAIELAFAIGDQPWEYEPSQTKPVHWCDKVMLARGFNPGDFA
jgi:hypothetical protein